MKVKGRGGRDKRSVKREERANKHWRDRLTPFFLPTHLDELWHCGLGWLVDDQKPHLLVLDERGCAWQVAVGVAGAGSHGDR